MSLKKVADGQFKAVATCRRTFCRLSCLLSVVNGSVIGSGDDQSTIPIGSVESETFTVTRTDGTTGAVTVDIDSWPDLPQSHYGYAVVKSADLPLEVIAESFLNSRTPAVRDAIVAGTPWCE